MQETYTLEMTDITKSFPGVLALDKAKLQVRPGEIHALMGANGAGKSTMMKILAGIYCPDEGSILLEGRSVVIKSPSHAQHLGISIVFQELNVLPHLSVLENIFINRELMRGCFYDWKAMEKRTHEILRELGIDMDIHKKVQSLPIAQQQMVEIVKAVSTDAKIIILDEPTSSLSAKEVETLYAIIRKLHKNGVSIVYISHRLDEIYDLCGRITLMRDGQWIFTEDIENVTRDHLVNSIIGKKLEDEFPARIPNIGDELLRVEGLTSQAHFRCIDFTLHAGEVLGFAGLMGAGRTEIGKAIFGEFDYQTGQIMLDGKPFAPRDSCAALKMGIAYATEDRKTEGLLLGRSIRENESLASIDRVTRFGLIDQKREQADVRAISEQLRIKTPSLEQKAVNLSGGNQQKVCLAKWMLTQPRILILDEPTRGIDVGAKAEFYKIINDLAGQGVGVILISSEESELIGLCDRILVFREGALMGEVQPRQEDCKRDMMRLMLGVTRNAG